MPAFPLGHGTLLGVQLRATRSSWTAEPAAGRPASSAAHVPRAPPHSPPPTPAVRGPWPRSGGAGQPGQHLLHELLAAVPGAQLAAYAGRLHTRPAAWLALGAHLPIAHLAPQCAGRVPAACLPARLSACLACLPAAPPVLPFYAGKPVGPLVAPPGADLPVWRVQTRLEQRQPGERGIWQGGRACRRDAP